MANITPELMKKVEKIARKRTSNIPDFEDAYQEGLVKICELEDGHTESYYAKAAEFRIRDYLKKERLHNSREVQLEDSEFENLTGEPRYYAKQTHAPDYDNADFDDDWSQSDQVTQKWLNGEDVSKSR